MATKAPGLARPNYFDGMALGVADFDSERDYLDALRRQYNTRLRTSGIARGLDVCSIKANAYTLRISSGLAIDAEGREIWLTADRVVGIEQHGKGYADVFISCDGVPADLTDETFARGYKRIDYRPVVSVVKRGTSVAPLAIFLASAILDDDGKIVGLELDARRHCGVTAGAVDFRARRADGDGDDAACARLSAQARGTDTVLNIAAAGLTFQGSVQIAGTLAIGNRHPHATLDILSADDRLIAIHNVDFQQDADQRDQNNEPPLLVVDYKAKTGQLHCGIKCSAPSAALDVAGDIELDAGFSVMFDQNGTVSGGGSPPTSTLALRETGMTFSANSHILLFSGPEPAPQPNGAQARIPTLRLDPHSGSNTGPGLPPTPTNVCRSGLTRAGIGIKLADPLDVPGLTVAGAVQSLRDGFVFANNSVQTTGAVSATVPVGTVIDWWPGNPLTTTPVSYAVSLPVEFVICDGSIVNDPQSPFNGTAVPKLVKLFVRGADDTSTIGVTGGAKCHTHSINAIPVHTHPVGHSHASIVQGTDGSQQPGPSNQWTGGDFTPPGHGHEIEFGLDPTTTSDSGQNGTLVSPAVTTDPFPNLPPSVGLFKIIRIK